MLLSTGLILLIAEVVARWAPTVLKAKMHDLLQLNQ